MLFLFIMVVRLIKSLTPSREVSRIPEVPSANWSLCIPHSGPRWASPAQVTVDNGLLNQFTIFFNLKIKHNIST